MLPCRHDLLFLFCLLLFYILLPSMGWLCGVGVFGLIECSHSLPALHCGLQNNNNNNNNNKHRPNLLEACRIGVCVTLLGKFPYAPYKYLTKGAGSEQTLRCRNHIVRLQRSETENN